MTPFLDIIPIRILPLVNMPVNLQTLVGDIDSMAMCAHYQFVMRSKNVNKKTVFLFLSFQNCI